MSLQVSPAFSETLVVVDRHNPQNGQLELLVGAQQRGQWQDFFNFPGGKVDAGESDVDGALRELAEETGLELSPADLSWLGMIHVVNFRRTPVRLGAVSVYGAHLTGDRPIRSKADEFDCLWIDPGDRNMLLNMPRDVGYWLPTTYQDPRYPFTCNTTVQPDGTITHETYLHIPQEPPIAVTVFARNL